MKNYLLAIDQGTTNSRAIIFHRDGRLIGLHEIPLTQSFPQAGWVEQNPEEMVANTILCCQEALKKSGLHATEINAIGISNQRETTIIWDKQSGKPIYPAIVWQDRRTSAVCKKLENDAFHRQIQAKTGLLLDPYFSATKIAWLLDHVPGAREQALAGKLLFGTVETYLLWKLTRQQVHITDATNAARTLLFNIHTQEWDQELLDFFAIPRQLLPDVYDNAADFGLLEASILGAAIPIAGMAGDQQAATAGQACFQPGMIKATYGTGCFMLMNTGTKVVQSKNRLLATIAYRINKQVTYGLEGSIFCAGVTIKWLRDTLQLIKTAAESETLAKSITSTEGLYLVPAFTGLGAPYWDPQARGALLGLTRNSGRAEIVRAALESVVYQTRDLTEAMTKDSAFPLTTLRVDGGMTANQWLLQFLADQLHLQIDRPVCTESSALGVAFLAGLQTGLYSSLEEIAHLWQHQATFLPQMSKLERESLYQGWKQAIFCILNKKNNCN